jgi:hypothetical protein
VPGTGESYIALARKRRLSAAGCSFRRNDVYALDPAADPGIIRIDRLGRARRFADLPSGAFLSGIAFDTVGRFGYRLLVTALFGENMTLYALDCRGRSSVILHAGPRVEGGIAVAPRTFGRFAGQSAGVRPGDLLVATEGGAITFAIRCRQRCTVRRIGRGPTATHGEGHLTVVPAGRPARSTP